MRQRNVILFGVPDEDVVELGDESFDDDREAFNHIVGKLGIRDELEVTDLFRMGKKDVSANNRERKCRPIKICFKTSNSTRLILGKSKGLKNAFGEGVNIYAKPDKSKAERDEFTRLGKRKKELMESHVTREGDAERVVLKNGRLMVDGVEFDSYKTPQTLF